MKLKRIKIGTEIRLRETNTLYGVEEIEYWKSAVLRMYPNAVFRTYKRGKCKGYLDLYAYEKTT
jgi:hypothetical protein